MSQLNKTASAETQLFFWKFAAQLHECQYCFYWHSPKIITLLLLYKFKLWAPIIEFWCFFVVLILWIQQNGENLRIKWMQSELHDDLLSSEISLLCLSCTEAEITSHDPNLTSTSVTACGVHWNLGLHSHSTLFPLTALVFSNSWDRKQKAFKAVRLRLCSKWHSWYVLMVLQTCHGSCACETVEHPNGYFRDFATAHFAEALMQDPAKLYWTVYAT